jgi:hypothetical protein
MYDEGAGAPEDEVKADYWYRKRKRAGRSLPFHFVHLAARRRLSLLPQRRINGRVSGF